MRCDNCFYSYGSGDNCPECGYAKGNPPGELYYLYPGTVLNGRYVIGKAIGAGGFGLVYSAWDNEENRLVAIKEYYPSGFVTRIPGQGQIRLIAKSRAAEFESGKRRFNVECEITVLLDKKFLSSPWFMHGVSYFDCFGTTYLVMEHLNGRSVTAEVMKDDPKMEKGAPLPIEQGMPIMHAMLSAVQDMHSVGVIHRDISPDNIIVGGERATLFDFGAAKRGRAKENSVRVMKPGFSPPEQYEPDDRTGTFTDMYALGATFYFMLTGVKPEESTNRKTASYLAEPKELNKDIPTHVSDAILRAMAVDPRLRFKTIDEFRTAITGEQKCLRPEAEVKRRAVKRFTTISATFIIMCLLGVGSYFYADSVMGTLNNASIEVWYVLSGDIMEDARRQSALAQVFDDFQYVHPNIEITLRGVPREDMANEVMVAMSEGVPILFESGFMNIEDLAGTVDLNAAARRVRSDVHFLDSYAQYFPQRNQLPTGFSVAAIYINTAISSFDEAHVGDLSALLASMPTTQSRIAVYPPLQNNFVRIFGQVAHSTVNDFFEHNAGAFFADTTMHSIVQRDMAGLYRLAGLDAQNIPAEFGGIFSVSESGRNEQAAKIRLLEFMLNDLSQDVLHIEHRSGLLPLNTTTLESFENEFSDFSGFFEFIDRYLFD